MWGPVVPPCLLRGLANRGWHRNGAASVYAMAKVSAKSFLELLQHSKLLDRDEIKRTLADCKTERGGSLPDDPKELAVGAAILVIGIGGHIGFGGNLPISILPGIFPDGLPAIATAAVVGIVLNAIFLIFKAPEVPAAES